MRVIQDRKEAAADHLADALGLLDSGRSTATVSIEQLIQLTQVTWDGDLISKQARTNLVTLGFSVRGGNGFNVITPSGLDFLAREGVISP